MLSLTNPWVILALLLVIAGAGVEGAKLGADHEIAKQAKVQDLIAQVKEQAQKGAAEAIAKNRPINQYNKEVLEHEIRVVPDYSRCVNSPDGMRAINSALEGERADSAGVRGMPKTDTPNR